MVMIDIVIVRSAPVVVGQQWLLVYGEAALTLFSVTDISSKTRKVTDKPPCEAPSYKSARQSLMFADQRRFALGTLEFLGTSWIAR